MSKANASLILMLAVLAGVYLPFYVLLSLKFDVFSLTICGIGYRMGEFAYLFMYGLMTGAFLIFQIYFFAKVICSKNKLLHILPVIAALMFMATVFTPIRETDPAYILKLHDWFGYLSAGFSMVAVSLAVFLYCIHNKSAAKRTLICYLLILAFAVTCFYFIGNKAVLQVGISLVFFIFMFFLNLSAFVNEKKLEHQQWVVENNVLPS